MAGTQRTGGEHLAEGSVTTGAAPPHTVSHILRRYYTVWAVYSLANGFLFGVYPLFLRARGLNQFQMNSVLATYFAVTFLTDVPTGAFADALGRRRSFVLGCMLRVSAFMVYFFAHAYPIFLVAEAIDGVGTTFCNGAIDAWGVDALDDAGFVGLKDRLFSRISQLMNIGFMVSALIGTYVADVNIAWPWLMSATGYAISAIVGATLMQERAGRRTHVAFAKIPRQVVDRIVNGFRRGFRGRTILMLSLANGIFFAASAPYWLEWPQYVNDSYGLGIWVVGWVYCLLTIGRLAGAEIVMRMSMDEARAFDPPGHFDRGGERGLFCRRRGCRTAKPGSGLLLPDERADRRDDAPDAELVQRADRIRRPRHATFVQQHFRDDGRGDRIVIGRRVRRRSGDSSDMEDLRGDLPRGDPVLLADSPRRARACGRDGHPCFLRVRGTSLSGSS